MERLSKGIIFPRLSFSLCLEGYEIAVAFLIDLYLLEAFSHSTFSTLHAYYLNILNSLAALVRMNGRDSREGSSEPRRSKGILQTSNRKGGMEKVRSKQAIRRRHTKERSVRICDDRSRRMPCHCWRSSVERLQCRAQVMRKKQEPWHWSKQVKRIPHEVQQVPQGTEGRCCSNSSLREKLLKLFNLVIEKARAPSPSFFFSIPEDYCHCYIIPNLKKVVKGWASLPSILIKLHLQQRYLLLICNLSGCIPYGRA